MLYLDYLLKADYIFRVKNVKNDRYNTSLIISYCEGVKKKVKIVLSYFLINNNIEEKSIDLTSICVKILARV